MNIEQHEHRIQGIVAEACREMGVRMETSTEVDENGHMHVTNGCDLSFYRRRTVNVSLLAALATLTVSALAFTWRPEEAMLIATLAHAFASLSVLYALHVVNLPLITMEDVQNGIAKRLAESGYTVRQYSGSTRVTWE